MKFIRHVLSHLLLITLLVGVCAVYFFRYELLPEMYTQKVDRYAEAIHPKLVTIANKKASQPEAQQEARQDKVTEAKQEIDVIYVDDVPLVDESKEQETAGAEEEEITTAKTQPVDEKTKEETIADNIAESEKEIAVATETEAKQEVVAEEVPVEVAGNTTDEAEAVVSDKDAADFHMILRDARSAFARGNMDTAVTKYNELIELENDEADFHGELGNVYYAMGKWNEAGASYYEAAVRLIENNQMVQVGYLQRVIQGLDAERAEKLAKQLANR